MCCRSRSSAIPTRASRPSSTRSPTQARTRPISSSPRSTRPRGASGCRRRTRSCSPIRWASSAICRPRSAPALNAADHPSPPLDTPTRRIWLPPANPVVLSDTVGFIRDLPHTLVAAFRATLEETVRADLLLHVVDATSPVREAQQGEVNKVLKETGAHETPQLLER